MGRTKRTGISKLACELSMENDTNWLDIWLGGQLEKTIGFWRSPHAKPPRNKNLVATAACAVKKWLMGEKKEKVNQDVSAVFSLIFKSNECIHWPLQAEKRQDWAKFGNWLRCGGLVQHTANHLQYYSKIESVSTQRKWGAQKLGVAPWNKWDIGMCEIF